MEIGIVKLLLLLLLPLSAGFHRVAGDGSNGTLQRATGDDDDNKQARLMAHSLELVKWQGG